MFSIYLGKKKSSIKKIILCSGKVFYDLDNKRIQDKKDHIAIIRIEQLYPFPYDDLEKYLKKYKNVDEIIWCQEEPKNQGAWYTMKSRIEACLPEGNKLTYAGRDAAAAPAAHRATQWHAHARARAPRSALAPAARKDAAPARARSEHVHTEKKDK